MLRPFSSIIRPNGVLVNTARRTQLSATFGTLAVLVAFTAPLANLNQTAVGLGAGSSGRTWILSSMSIGLGAFLLTAGRIADDFGRRRTFVVGAFVLALGSAVAAVTPDVEVFVLARIVQGLGGAAVVAAGLGMLATAFPDPLARARVTGLWGASVGAGIALGPILSTWLGRWHSWRDVDAVLAVAALSLAGRARRVARGHADRLPRVASRPPRPARRPRCAAAGTGHERAPRGPHRGT